MSNPDDQLDRLLDAFAGRGENEESEVDEETERTVRLLFQKAGSISPSAGFIHRLESIVVQDATMRGSGSRSQIAKGVYPSPTTRRWAGRAIGSAALAMLAIVAMTVIYQTGPDEPIFTVASVAASPSSLPAVTDCNRDPVPDAAGRAALSSTFGPSQLNEILKVWRLAPNDPAITVAIVPDSALPAGTTVDNATRSEVETAVRREIACRNFQMYGWSATADPTPGASTPQSGNQTGQTSPGANLPALVMPDDLAMTLLADGEVGVALPEDLFDSGLRAFAIFAPYQGDWFMTEYTLTASDAWLTSSYRGAAMSNRVTVHIEDSYVWPAEISVPCCQPVTITIVNHSMKTHSFTFTGHSLSQTLAAGASTSIEATEEPGGDVLLVDAGTHGQEPLGVYFWAVATEHIGVSGAS